MTYEAEYNNRARVPEHPELMAGWARDAAAFRAEAVCELGVPYGATDRQKLDYFFPGKGLAGFPGTPVILFFHGGYWQALSRSDVSHLARGPVAHGATVVMAGYDLAPAISLAEIVAEARAACLAVWRRFRRPIVVAGHSAGGHIAACMLATDWRQETDVPEDFISAAYAISGLFDLEPLVSTSVNKALGLDEEEARRLSPLLWQPPTGRALDAVVGALESEEYLRQSREICEKWAVSGVKTQFGLIPDANHFTAIAPLVDPASAMTNRLVALAKASLAPA